MFWLGLSRPAPQPVRLILQPLLPTRETEGDPRWEEWHCYLFPLAVGMGDYQRLLAGCFACAYPTRDAIDGAPAAALDPCSPNWLAAGDWERITAAVRREMAGASRKKARFYDRFLRWTEAALTHTDIIIADGNQ